MTYIQAFFLALIQGISEFLPISSSAHLILPSLLLNLEDQGLAFDVAVHFGTLGAVLLYYRHTFWQIIIDLKNSIKQKKIKKNSLAVLLVFATLPTVVLGFFLVNIIEIFTRDIRVIACATIFFALVLLLATFRKTKFSTLKNLTLSKVIFLGFLQALAFIPGTSRSGITITGLLFLGFNKQTAAKFSFLMSVPVILGASSLKLKDLIFYDINYQISYIIFATIVAFISAYLSIKIFLKLLNKIGMLPFILYRLALGAFLLYLI